MNKYLTWNNTAQVLLVVLTAAGFLLTSLKLPQYGLIFNLISQVFWLYSSYIAWKKADQIGMFIATLFFMVIVLGGVINYWFL